MSMENTLIIAHALAALMLLAAVYWDARYRRIPNLLTLGGAGVALVLQAMVAGLDGVWFGLGGWAVGLALLLPGYLLGFTGAGDVKLMAAAGAFLGPQTAFLAAIASILAGALLALTYVGYLAMSQAGTTPWERYGGMFRSFLVTGRSAYVPPAANEVVNHRFPYALAIAAGTLGVIGWESIAQ